MNLLVLETSFDGVPILTGKIAVNCKVTFLPTGDLNAVTDPKLHGLWPSCDGGWLFDGFSACPWHGGSELVDAASTCALKDF